MYTWHSHCLTYLKLERHKPRDSRPNRISKCCTPVQGCRVTNRSYVCIAQAPVGVSHPGVLL